MKTSKIIGSILIGLFASIILGMIIYAVGLTKAIIIIMLSCLIAALLVGGMICILHGK